MTKWIGMGGAALLMLTAVDACAAGVKYDCDTAADHFSELAIPAPTGPFSVSGDVKLLNLAASSKYVASTHIQIAADAEPGSSPSKFAGFSFLALAAADKKTGETHVVQMLNWSVSGEKDQGLDLSVLGDPAAMKHFRLAYDGKQVTVELDQQTRTVPIQIDHPVFRVVCSTGEFLLTDVVWQGDAH